jgi:hypothetical protein
MNHVTQTDNILIRLSAEEAQQALAIGIDEDAQEALSFLRVTLANLIKEKLHSS